MRQFIKYFWGTIVHPRATFDALAAENTIRWAMILACLPVLQVWGNMALHAAFGLDWLVTRPSLSDPIFIGGLGYLRIGLADWIPFYATVLPLVVLLKLVIISGVAQLMSKLWHGQGTFEQMVSALAFATLVPSMVIEATSEWLFGVPMCLLTGYTNCWVAAMQGEFGSVVSRVWGLYVIGVYITFQYAWAIALGSMAIRRIQRIPVWTVILTMLIAFAISMFLESTFVR